MPCRYDPTPAEIEAGRAAKKEREAKAKKKLTKLESQAEELQNVVAVQACKYRGLICSLVENDVPLSNWAESPEYKTIREEQLKHRRFDQQRKLEELTAQLILAKESEQEAIRNQIVAVANVNTEYDLLTGTQLF